MSVPAPRPEYLEFLKPFGAEITELALATRALVLRAAPGCSELIYDAYSAVATGYSYTGRPTDAFLHIAVYARWVNLGFNRGALLKDPEGLLAGTGRWTRHVRIARPSDLKSRPLASLVKAAVEGATMPPVPREAASVVRAIYARKRRPSMGVDEVTSEKPESRRRTRRRAG
jgi:hypothetical protein